MAGATLQRCCWSPTCCIVIMIGKLVSAMTVEDRGVSGIFPMKESAVCKMCGERSDFVNAHIIPRSFYPERARGKDGLSVLSSDPTDRKRRSLIGIYDNRLVCAGCERRFDPLDNYAAKLLMDDVTAFRTVNHHGQPLLYQADLFDYPKLKSFFLSLLWRAAATDRPEFANVDLGPFLPTLTSVVKRGDPGDADMFATIFAGLVMSRVGNQASSHPSATAMRVSTFIGSSPPPMFSISRSIVNPSAIR